MVFTGSIGNQRNYIPWESKKRFGVAIWFMIVELIPWALVMIHCGSDSIKLGKSISSFLVAHLESA